MAVYTKKEGKYTEVTSQSSSPKRRKIPKEINFADLSKRKLDHNEKNELMKSINMKIAAITKKPNKFFIAHDKN